MTFHDTCSKKHGFFFVHFYKNHFVVLFYSLLYFNKLIYFYFIVEATEEFEKSVEKQWYLIKILFFFWHYTCIFLCFWRRKLVVCRFPSSRPVRAEVCGVSHAQSRDCSLSSCSFAGERVEKGQGERWGHAEVCLFVRSRSVRCVGEQTGLCCVVKEVTLFLRAHCYHLYTEGWRRNYDSLSHTIFFLSFLSLRWAVCYFYSGM